VISGSNEVNFRDDLFATVFSSHQPTFFSRLPSRESAIFPVRCVLISINQLNVIGFELNGVSLFFFLFGNRPSSNVPGNSPYQDDLSNANGPIFMAPLQAQNYLVTSSP
jgi:hypothetical protein